MTQNLATPPAPAPRILTRPIDDTVLQLATNEGFSPLQARLIAGRLSAAQVAEAGSVERLIAPSLSQLQRPDGMPDIRRAAERIARAVINKEVVAIASDHDADGVTGQCVVWCWLVRAFGMPPSHVISMATHRLQEGYGLSTRFVSRVLALDPGPTLLISVDQGTSDQAAIEVLRQNGIATIVTDHHGCPASGPPSSAFATVNPTRPDSRYDPTVAGCYVAWILMTQVAAELRAAGHPISSAEDAKSLLDFVGLGTTVDCVSLSSINNRAVVLGGLRRMHTSPREAWKAFQAVMQPDPERRSPWMSSDLSFGAGPRLNARGRVDEAMAGVHALLADKVADARHWVATLNSANEERKDIERGLNAEALRQADVLWKAGQRGLVILLENGHVGIHGITASRVTEAYGLPTICCSPRPDDAQLLSGSCRSIPGINMKAVLDEIHDTVPGLLLKHGGHPGAAGLTLERDRLGEFASLFNAVVARLCATGDVLVGPHLWVDGPWPRTMALRDELLALEPYGRGFPPATFCGDYRVEKTTPMGDGTHLRLTLADARGAQSAIWFGARSLDDAKNGRLHIPRTGSVISRPLFGRYRGMDRVEMQVVRVSGAA